MKVLFVLVVLVVLAVICDPEEAPVNKLLKYAEATKLQVGVKKRIPQEECPVQVKTKDKISVHYTGLLAINGNKFDSSLDRGDPFVFTVGVGQVIKGWDQGLLGACVGEKRRLVIPPHLGYGERGSPPVIPANSVLVFEVEVMAIN